jgi:hypothetical protein
LVMQPQPDLGAGASHQEPEGTQHATSTTAGWRRFSDTISAVRTLTGCSPRRAAHCHAEERVRHSPWGIQHPH